MYRFKNMILILSYPQLLFTSQNAHTQSIKILYYNSKVITIPVYIDNFIYKFQKKNKISIMTNIGNNLKDIK